MKKAAFGALLGGTMLATTPAMAAIENTSSSEVKSTLGLVGTTVFAVAESSYDNFLADLTTLMAKGDSYNAVLGAFGVPDGKKVSVFHVPGTGSFWSAQVTFSGGTVTTRSRFGSDGLFSGTPAAVPGPIAGAGLPAALALLGIGGYLARRRSQTA